VFFPSEATNDFLVSMQVSKKHGIVYLMTKYGFIHLYNLETGVCVYMNRISGETIFVTAEHVSLHGIIGVNKKGQVLSISIDEQTIIPYILTVLNNTDLTFKMTSCGSLPGADNLYVWQYQTLFQSSQFGEAAKVAASSPRVSHLALNGYLERFADSAGSGNAPNVANHRGIQTGPCTARRPLSNSTVFRCTSGEGRAE